jgi:hypothetical protein
MDAKHWQTARRGRLFPPFGFANVRQKRGHFAKHWQNGKIAREGRNSLRPPETTEVGW